MVNELIIKHKLIFDNNLFDMFRYSVEEIFEKLGIENHKFVENFVEFFYKNQQKISTGDFNHLLLETASSDDTNNEHFTYSINSSVKKIEKNMLFLKIKASKNINDFIYYNYYIIINDINNIFIE